MEVSKIRKPLEVQTKHLTQEEIKIKKLEQESVFVGNEQLKIPPDWLVNEIATKEWVRLVEQFNKKSMISNLDYNNLGAYCNAFARYASIVTNLKTDVMIVEEINPLVSLELKYSDEMKRYGSLLGLTMESRLKAGSGIITIIDEKLDKEFGDV
ncbi:P27 family phage terminase small subunit [Cetobacterium sp. 2A]|uniref:P27 family phage terminase small subunit n=1 Tax=Cetobacterium sp. 2A TaxID=2754723 RepID=UPI00163C3AA6|nr:P27 family phage terminase small subunit [Cetobacterium sp. 2A]MBC2855257.1 P27 family phage terminase small subunit [Cetobacterium sp. 2A]MBC2855307.1 P27 family phage terminase small subunit [Cetobacterium sp. 2A]MBC2855608.1 P27 family phage terminase small subunit [Cetobacterium sp. 2A]MBC2856815.1 P27 family phage terminase small subunit [Cetobacterium sp. 2A]MBC2856856.1 P27 family phage terminase small subunit [Cetobacterium sp. 2A]